MPVGFWPEVTKRNPGSWAEVGTFSGFRTLYYYIKSWRVMLPSQFLLNATEPKESVQEINDISDKSVHKIVFERLHLFLSTAWKRLTHSPKSESFRKSLPWCCVLKNTLDKVSTGTIIIFIKTNNYLNLSCWYCLNILIFSFFAIFFLIWWKTFCRH